MAALDNPAITINVDRILSAISRPPRPPIPQQRDRSEAGSGDLIYPNTSDTLHLMKPGDRSFPGGNP
jgi:hypothetical protein